ncbi:MAG TPA: M48 family metallopeptidase [Myxococcota bacterium]|nr:M48 family metallopeptidase [Myxococcota bacterium]
MWPSCYSLWSWAALFCAALLLGCATTLSVDEERNLGAELDAEVRSEVIFEPDPVILKYVQKIGNEIVRAAPPQPYQFRFRVVDDDEINAFAGPAGYVYVHTAILKKARNVSEVAGVVAHEVGHVVKRHVAQNYNRAKDANMLKEAGVVAAALVVGGPVANLANLGGGLAAMAYVNSFGREAETEADAFAVEVLPKAGYDPEGLVTFFQTIQREYGNSSLSFLESHPAPSDRIEAATRLIRAESLPPDLSEDDGGELEIIQRRIQLLEQERAHHRTQQR